MGHPQVALPTVIQKGFYLAKKVVHAYSDGLGILMHQKEVRQ
jgi:hypothetical protein